MRIQKTLSATVFSSLLALPVLFSATAASAGPFDGAYVQGFIGGLNSDLTVSQSPEVNVQGSNQNGAVDVTPSDSSSAFTNSVFGGVGVGFNKVFNCRYLLGVEGTADFEDASLNKRTSVNEVKSGFFISSDPNVKLKNTFALLLTPGIIFEQNNKLLI